MKFKTPFLAAALLLAGGVASAAETTYTIDPTHSIPVFSYSHFGFSSPQARFDDISGTVKLDPAKKTGSVDVTIKVDSISTGVDKLDEHLESADFFDEDKYPTITFKSTALKFKGEALSSITGNLTIRDVTKPVTLKVTSFKCGTHPMKNVPACGATATTTFKRSDFGIAKYVPNVGDEVHAVLTVEATQQ